MRPEPAREGRRWLTQAENDLAFAELAARERFFAQACFNAQQAAEKALKAFRYGQGAEHVYGHSVAELLAECGKLDRHPSLHFKKVHDRDPIYARDPRISCPRASGG